jgi:hypothetical protein
VVLQGHMSGVGVVSIVLGTALTHSTFLYHASAKGLLIYTRQHFCCTYVMFIFGLTFLFFMVDIVQLNRTCTGIDHSLRIVITSHLHSSNEGGCQELS